MSGTHFFSLSFTNTHLYICHTQNPGFEPLKILLAFLILILAVIAALVISFVSNSLQTLHLFYNLPLSMKRSTPISGLPFMIISICTARRILYFSLPIHWSTNLFWNNLDNHSLKVSLEHTTPKHHYFTNRLLLTVLKELSRGFSSFPHWSKGMLALIQYEERKMVLFQLGYAGSFNMTALGNCKRNYTPCPFPPTVQDAELSPVRELQTSKLQPMAGNILVIKMLHPIYATQLWVNLGKEHFSLTE